ncbi:hypothetical protein M407DRAFT_220116 [Tulasnella calospora MUT 4182]|uniref:Uncharacterized protein n=1 Tax=Tulasnella calospora MUT 4182 TaxID=1051891 RepID=A0A0C3Q2P2_9AGAM|nr:hypothetical protein M407DRAFT_229294 [Tulasnella calospora MUT 4182]KIO20670.1 hypothetical protein M407DRAFT_220116 [Tulasnella calospora MUT 4182]
MSPAVDGGSGDDVGDPLVKDRKPEDWADEAQIRDPDAVKPDDQDEDVPFQILDEDVSLSSPLVTRHGPDGEGWPLASPRRSSTPMFTRRRSESRRVRRERGKSDRYPIGYGVSDIRSPSSARPFRHLSTSF